MKYIVDPVLVSKAIQGMSKVGKPNQGSPKIRMEFLDGGIALSRSDREQLVEFYVPARGTLPSGDSITVCLDWAKFASVMKNGVVASDVTIDHEVGNTFITIKQGAAIRVKLPTTGLDIRVPYAQPGDAVTCTIPDDKADTFFSGMSLVSTFCVDKIVGRGRFSGVVMHDDRVVASSHEGAFIANVPTGIAGFFGVPSGVVWTLLNLSQSKSLAVTIGAGAVSQGQVKSAYIAGTLDTLKWIVEFGFYQPFHTFMGLDLTKPAPASDTTFDLTMECGHLHGGFATASAVQGKADVWVEVADLTEIGFSIRGRDIARTVESSVNVPISEFSGDLMQPVLQVKKSCFMELLGQLKGTVRFGFDQKGGKMVLAHSAGTGFMCCNVGEE